MKQYVILFLLLFSQCAFAPRLSEVNKTVRTQEISKISKVNMIEESEDSVSLNHIKAFKFNNFTKEDRRKVRRIANNLGIKERWLYKAIYIESRGKTKAVNRFTGATGLIQFTPRTARRLGTTVSELYDMSTSEQLDYVEKYLKLASKGKKMRKMSDLYMAIFSPGCIGLNDDHIVGEKNSSIVRNNRGLDVDKDSTITVRDIKLFIAEVML